MRDLVSVSGAVLGRLSSRSSYSHPRPTRFFETGHIISVERLTAAGISMKISHDTGREDHMGENDRSSTKR